MNITFEERQLMSLYNTGTRTGLIAALEEMRGYLAADETELRELTDSAIAKLRRMSDAEYDALDLFPDFEKEDILRSRKPRAMSGWVLLWMSGTFITISRMKQSRWGICPAWVISIAPAFQRKRSA